MDIKEHLFRQINEAKSLIQGRTKIQPSIGIILGSGLGKGADFLRDSVTIPYEDIPHFPTSITEGHEGNLIIGTFAKRNIVVMQGRFHLYEGYTARGIALPIQVLNSLGAGILIITNSAGAINKKLKVGSFMLIKDQINLTGENPLLGPNIEELGPRFPSMVNAYDQDLRAIAKKVGKERKVELTEGVYTGLKGPNYETPSEINFLKKLGGDAVGMSTVLEVIAARHIGSKVLGISCLTNLAARELHDFSHKEVIKTAKSKCSEIRKLIRGVIEKIELD